jgi:hypothetical protein
LRDEEELFTNVRTSSFQEIFCIRDSFARHFRACGQICTNITAVGSCELEVCPYLWHAMSAFAELPFPFSCCLWHCCTFHYFLQTTLKPLLASLSPITGIFTTRYPGRPLGPLFHPLLHVSEITLFVLSTQNKKKI